MTKPGVMTKFRIDELSGVDEPCQKGARAVFMKRRFTEEQRQALADKGHAMKDGSFPIETVADLSNAVQALGRAKEPDAAKRHIIQRARALDATDQLPEEWKVKKAGEPGATDSEGEPMSAIKKALGLPETATDDEVAAAITKRDDDLKAATEESTRLAKFAALPEDQRGHYAELEKADKKKASDFLDMTEADRAKCVAKAKEGDETVELEGRTISKRAVGDDTFHVLKAQAARIAKSEEDIKKANEAAANATFTKRAETEFGHVAGSTEERVLVLKALAQADEATQKAGEAILKAAEASAKVAFSKAGYSGGKGGEGSDAGAELKKMAEDAVAKSGGKLTFAKAYSDILQTAEGAALYEKTLSAPVEE